MFPKFAVLPSFVRKRSLLTNSNRDGEEEDVYSEEEDYYSDEEEQEQEQIANDSNSNDAATNAQPNPQNENLGDDHPAAPAAAQDAAQQENVNDEFNLVEEDEDEYNIIWEDVLNMPKLAAAIEALPEHTVAKNKALRRSARSIAKGKTPDPTPGGLTHSGLCVVCQEEFKEGDVLRELPCEHSFHKKCIFPWIPPNMNCPLCREDIFYGDQAKELGAERRRYLKHIDRIRDLRADAQDQYEREAEASGRRQAMLDEIQALLEKDEEDGEHGQ